MMLQDGLFHGTPAWTLQSADGAQAVVTLHGAHVVSWRPSGGHGEQLYLSPRSGFADGQAIRGGVPVVFPQFSDRGPLPRHGLARDRAWQLLRHGLDADGAATAVLGLTDGAATRAIWPHAFALELRLRLLGQQLELGLHCANTGTEPWAFAAGLHTYLQVPDSAQATIAGLAGRGYHDALDRRDKTQQDPWLAIPGEVDRIYPGVATAVELHRRGEPAAPVLRVAHAGFSDLVIWNPGPQRCALLPDMPADGYRAMVCIESARIIEPVLLEGAQTWLGVQRLQLLA